MLFWCFNLPAYCRPQLAAARCTLITEALLLLGIYNLTLTLSTDDVLNEEGHAKEKNNNSRCWLICVSVAHCHPAPTYIKQAAGGDGIILPHWFGKLWPATDAQCCPWVTTVCWTCFPANDLLSSVWEKKLCGFFDLLWFSFLFFTSNLTTAPRIQICSSILFCFSNFTELQQFTETPTNVCRASFCKESAVTLDTYR